MRTGLQAETTDRPSILHILGKQEEAGGECEQAALQSCACLLRFADAARCLAGTERTPVSTPQSLMAAAALAWLGLALRLRGGALQGSQLGDLPRQPLAPALALQEAAKTRALERDGREAPPYRDPRKHPGIHAVGWSRRGKHLGGRWAGEDRVDQASLSRPGLHCSCCLLFWKNLTPKYLSVLHGRPWYSLEVAPARTELMSEGADWLLRDCSATGFTLGIAEKAQTYAVVKTIKQEGNNPIVFQGSSSVMSSLPVCTLGREKKLIMAGDTLWYAGSLAVAGFSCHLPSQSL